MIPFHNQSEHETSARSYTYQHQGTLPVHEHEHANQLQNVSIAGENSADKRKLSPAQQIHSMIHILRITITIYQPGMRTTALLVNAGVTF